MTPRAFELLVAFVLALGLAPASAYGDTPSPPTPIFVVTVDAATTELDAAGLRSAIAKELEASAVAPGDPRASQARGIIAVSIDRARGGLVVSYREHGESIARTIALPPDAAATVRAAVLLAGNLARDEAGELAAELRRTAPPHESEPSKVVREDQEEHAARGDLDRIEETLSRYGRNHRTPLTVLGWTTVGLAGASGSAGLYLGLQHNGASDATNGVVATVLEDTALPLAIVGVWTVIIPTSLSPIDRYYSENRATDKPPTQLRDEVEAVWERAARQEASSRNLAGGILIASGATEGIVSAVMAYEVDRNPPNRVATLQDASGVVTGGVLMGLGLLLFIEDGPVVSALHAYEGASGRHVLESGVQDVGLRLVPSPRGGLLGLGGSF